MHIRSLAVALLVLVITRGAAAQSGDGRISLNGEILVSFAVSPERSLFDGDTSGGRGQQNGGGYYRPVTPVPYHRACGTVSTDICAVPVNVPPGATGEQVFEMMKEAANSGRQGEALSYLEKSAELGYPLAEGTLGLDYLRGIGEQSDTEKGLYWLNRSAEHGQRNAQVVLGEVYEDGSDNVPRNEARAIVLFKQAAAQGQSKAEYRLGIDYEISRGVAHNRALAIEYLRKAAAGGQQEAGVTANFLARAGSGQYHSEGELDAAMQPPAPAQRVARSNGYSSVGTPCGTNVQTRYTWAWWCKTNPGCPIHMLNDEKVYYCPAK